MILFDSSSFYISRNNAQILLAQSIILMKVVSQDNLIFVTFASILRPEIQILGWLYNTFTMSQQLVLVKREAWHGCNFLFSFNSFVPTLNGNNDFQALLLVWAWNTFYALHWSFEQTQSCLRQQFSARWWVSCWV